MKYKCSHLLSRFVWLLLFCLSCCADSGSTASTIQCIAKERDALLQFKNGIEVDKYGMLSSWVGQECCLWNGISCSNNSNHVISLDLGGSTYLSPLGYELMGTVSQSLVELKHLKYLNLSNNDFGGQPMPSFIGSLLDLKFLDLSNSNFVGEVPHQLSNLSRLTYLGLGNPGLDVKNLMWLSHLTLLTNIDLTYANLSLATNWMQTVNNLHLLKSLHMDACSLPIQTSLSLLKYTNSSTTLDTLSLVENGWKDTRVLEWVSNFTRLSSTFSYLDLSYNGFSAPIPSLLGNMHSLLHLDLSVNSFEGPIPETISNLKHLVHLDLSFNKFEGPIPETISNLKHLVHLDLSFNTFEGPIPEGLGSLCSLQMLSLGQNNITSELSTIIQPLSQCIHKSLLTLNIANNHIWGSLSDEIGTFSSLRELDLYNNQLNGAISPSLGQLSSLRELSLSSNSLKGTISNHHLSNLSRLTELDLSDNPELVFDISANWVPPFQLDVISLGSCKLGLYFPKWLLTQTNFSSLDISNSSISDTIPTAFWNSLQPDLSYLGMYGNMIHGNIPAVPISFHNKPEIDLSSNLFDGSIPSFLRNASRLFLNDNNFSDCGNFFHPRTKVVLSLLILSNNKLSGELPGSWGYFDQLIFLHLDGNSFCGSLPNSMCMLTRLESLHLRKNNISGKIPIALRKCNALIMLDLSYNSLTGTLPYWFGNVFDSLAFLSVRSNDFRGGLPLSLCQMPILQILDLSTNHFFGFIPKCIYNLMSMIVFPSDRPARQLIYNGRIVNEEFSPRLTRWESAWIMWKREESPFKENLGLVKVIDMSNNELEGPIPDGISSLTGLQSLDLSRNRLNESITPNIGKLTSLQYLDLSRNQLCGEIPSSLSAVSFLETLDVSYNNLSGQIPLGTQLQSFNVSSYIGNPRLCGEPLPKCHGSTTPSNSPKEDKSSHDNDNDADNLFPGLYISVILGFIVGFWGVCGTLVIKRSWRHAFFSFFDKIKDKLCVFVLLNKVRVLQKNT